MRLSKINQVDDSDGDSAKLGMIDAGHVLDTCQRGHRLGLLAGLLESDGSVDRCVLVGEIYQALF
jgi:hypothetical protein